MRGTIERDKGFPILGEYLSSNLFRLLILAFVFSSSRFSGAAEPRTIEIYENHGTYSLDAPPPDMRPVVLSIPDQFLYGSGGAAPKRNWGVNVLTYYPNFTSPRDPSN